MKLATINDPKEKFNTIPVMDGDLLVGLVGKADLLRTIVG